MGGSLSFPVVDLNGKVVIVTGGNAGIGYEAAKSIAIMGAHTIIACRSREKATTAIEQMKQEINEEHPDKSVTIEFMILDLASFRSTKDFTVAFKEKNLPLHILINNAGIFGHPQVMTEDGNESHFQVNHLGHFLLTLELLPIMLDTATSTGDCRIVAVSSWGHFRGQFVPNNMNGEQSYDRLPFYCHSKLYNVMHGYALQRRLQNVGITVSSLNPGTVSTDAGEKGLDNTWKLAIWKFGRKTFFKTPQQGAVNTINCAVNPELNKQQHYYYDSCNVKAPSSQAMSFELQEQLWEISINIVKDWMTPEILEKYGSRMEATPTNKTVEGESTQNQKEEEETGEETGGDTGETPPSDLPSDPPPSEDVEVEKNEDSSPVEEKVEVEVNEAKEEVKDDTTDIREEESKQEKNLEDEVEKTNENSEEVTVTEDPEESTETQ